jgi:hypothetical protein
MIATSARLLTFEPRPPAGAAAPVMRAGREPTAATSWRGATEAEAERTMAHGAAIGSGNAAAAPGAAVGRAGFGAAPFLAQLFGQHAAPRDAVSAGRGQTSFRVSPAEKYEETQRWTRRVEFLFAFEGLDAPIPA